MIEAVGHEHMQAYFRTLGAMVKPGGRVVIQVGAPGRGAAAAAAAEAGALWGWEGGGPGLFHAACYLSGVAPVCLPTDAHYMSTARRRGGIVERTRRAGLPCPPTN